MANPPVSAPEKPSLFARLRRELRNPSMLTVTLIVVAVLAGPLAVLVPSWVETAQQSLRDRAESNERRDAQLVDLSVQLPSQIAPWLLDRIEVMESASSPAEWNETLFTDGPCNANNLSQIPTGPFVVSVAETCESLQKIQSDHASECGSVQVCNISDTALGRLGAVRVALLDTFADAGLVIPYEREEEPVGP